MKKFIACTVALVFAASISAQENDLKNVRFGLYASPTFNWYTPDNDKKFENAGMKVSFAWGLNVDYRLSDVAAIYFGIGMDGGGQGNINFLDTAAYYYDTANESILDAADTTGKTYTVNMLNSRVYKQNYIILPIGLKFKTKEIGYMTYYGSLGFQLGIKYGAKADDNVKNLVTQQTSDLTDLDIGSDTQLLRTRVRIGGGFEYTFSGSTSLLFGVHYNMGLNNVLKKNSDQLLNDQNQSLEQVAKANGVSVTIGVLF